jgi:signal transduction histidine kinase
MPKSTKTSSKRICDLTVSAPLSHVHASQSSGGNMSVPAEEKQRECDELVTHLQNAAELKDTALSHELHDDLGGLMGAAVMDLEAVRRVKPALSQNALNCVERVKQTLEQAIDLERRVIEELRPSILDNFGLFAALRWQLKKTWGHSEVVSTETFPDVEPQFESHAATSLFRIAQEALSIALKRTSVKSTDLTVSVDHENFWMRFSDDGVANAETQTKDSAAMYLASIRHRICAMGGNVHLFIDEAGATVLTVSMPLPNIVSY